jgi:cob(I)alamin adenosyltransferase
MSKGNGCRVTKFYKAGATPHKPPGMSELYNGEIVGKDDISTSVWGGTDSVCNSLDFSLIERKEKGHTIPLDFHTFLIWLRKNIFSFGSFCFMTTKTDHHIFSEEILKNMDVLSKRYQIDTELISTDFVGYDLKLCVYLDKVRIEIRELEVAWARWRVGGRLMNYLMYLTAYEPELLLPTMQNVVRMTEIINRISTVLYWGSRAVYEQNKTEEHSLFEWPGKAQDFYLVETELDVA